MLAANHSQPSFGSPIPGRRFCRAIGDPMSHALRSEIVTRDESGPIASGTALAPHRTVTNQPPVTPPRLMDQVRQACRLRHFSHRTEDAYCHWIRRFIVFHQTRHPAQLGASEIERFLSSLATDRHVSASTQNQALCALLFLYRTVIQVTLPPLANIVRVRTPPRLPAVLNRSEVRAVLNQLEGVPWLVASLLYGAGLRLLECLELRVKDIDFERR